MSCNRCGKEANESIEVMKASYYLCNRCLNTFLNRWQNFMASGSLEWKLKKRNKNEEI